MTWSSGLACRRSTDRDFFSEWQQELPPLTAEERSRLARVEAGYANLERRSLLEKHGEAGDSGPAVWI
jgi:hypothetical protein